MSDAEPWWRDRWLWAISALAAVLLLWNLGGRCLWQDEAETALLGRAVLRAGVPVASDGRNLVSQEVGREFGADRVWRWSPWGQFYAAAAGLKLFGDTALGARLPFAIAALLTIPFVYLLGRRALGSLLAARIAALLLAASPWFLLHARQARWHALAYLLACVVLLGAFEARRAWSASVILALAGAALFYVNYFVAICFLAAIAVASPLLQRGRLFFARLFAGLAGAALLALPGAIYFDVAGKSGGTHELWKPFVSYLVQFLTFLAPLAVVAVAAWGDRRPEMRFLFALTIVTCALLSLAPWLMFRYVTILFPVAALIGGSALAWLFRRDAYAGAVALALLLCTNVVHRLPLGFMDVPGTKQAEATWSPLVALIGEIAVPPRDAECAAADWLNAHGSPRDTVVATYGDLVLQFSTPMRVAGGLEGQPLPRRPEWIVARGFVASMEPGKDYSVYIAISGDISGRDYQVVATAPDPTLSGDPDPAFHRFHGAVAGNPMRIYRRVR